VFTTNLRSVDVPEGMALVLECHVTGTPLPTVSWFQDQKQLEEAVVMAEPGARSKSSVVIGRVRPEHSGEYVCQATNSAGQTVTSAAIRVVRTYLLIINPLVFVSLKRNI